MKLVWEKTVSIRCAQEPSKWRIEAEPGELLDEKSCHRWWSWYLYRDSQHVANGVGLCDTSKGEELSMLKILNDLMGQMAELVVAFSILDYEDGSLEAE